MIEVDNDGYYQDVDDARDDYDDKLYFRIESRELVRDNIKKGVEQDERNYIRNKKAKVGTKIMCAGPMCHKIFTKKSYQQAFCCTKHKDQFWNRREAFYGVKIPIVI